ncbi:hypothetical protein RND81_05G084600 [Saponaria officinalis]|uniref:Uncharacterized protein n=1 Tax=Saponaria officinalis TaxID=3572 RepID=A0AAW1KR26_SAPOF
MPKTNVFLHRTMRTQFSWTKLLIVILALISPFLVFSRSISANDANPNQKRSVLVEFETQNNVRPADFVTRGPEDSGKKSEVMNLHVTAHVAIPTGPNPLHN